jgi:hypothetical protein
MPKREEDKPPQRTIRSDNVYEQINTLANPERDDTDIYQDTITRNQTLSNFDKAGEDFQKQGQILHVMLASEGEYEAADAVNALMQGDANIRRGINGKTQEMITTYTVKQTINKKVTGEKKPLLGGKQEG